MVAVHACDIAMIYRIDFAAVLRGNLAAGNAETAPALLAVIPDRQRHHSERCRQFI